MSSNESVDTWLGESNLMNDFACLGSCVSLEKSPVLMIFDVGSLESARTVTDPQVLQKWIR